jgi:mRNA interferase RelE/StbE
VGSSDGFGLDNRTVLWDRVCMAEAGYHVEIELSAAKTLAAITKGDQARITEKIAALSTDPRPHNAVKLTGANAWRIRSGDYRIVYVIEDSVRIVTVTRVAHRREVYRRL